MSIYTRTTFLLYPRQIKLKEIFETEDKLFLVLELVTGGELFDRIVAQGYFSEKDAANVVRQLCSAVQVSFMSLVHGSLFCSFLLTVSTFDMSLEKISIKVEVQHWYLVMYINFNPPVSLWKIHHNTCRCFKKKKKKKFIVYCVVTVFMFYKKLLTATAQMQKTLQDQFFLLNLRSNKNIWSAFNYISPILIILLGKLVLIGPLLLKYDYSQINCQILGLI